MDEVIFEEFKGTGNMELVLDRELVRPAHLPRHRHQEVGHAQGGAAAHPDELNRIWILRKVLSPLSRSRRWS